MTATEMGRAVLKTPHGQCPICRDTSFVRVDSRWMHYCCDHWARHGWSRCPACAASRTAQHTRQRRKVTSA